MKLRKKLPVIAMLWIALMGGCQKIDVPVVRPLVTSTNPVNQATNIAINSKFFNATFSVPMDPMTLSTTTFTIMQGTTAVAGTVTYKDSTVFFTPTANLAPNLYYTATINMGAKNMSGNSLAKDFSWSFTTSTNSDLTPPTVSVTNPLNNSTGVAVNIPIVTTFSEAMDQTTINTLTYSLKQGTFSVPGTITYTGTIATFTPTTVLDPVKIYTGTITTGAKDLAGNALVSNYTFSFTTGNAPDITLPMVYTIDPLNNVTGVARNKVVALTFSKAMNPLTINAQTFTLMQGTNSIPGAVAYTGTTATFTPTNTLSAGTAYTATITTGAKDIAGNALAANTVWSFTTGGTTSTLAVVDLGGAGNFVILAKTAITDIPASAITGDMGLSPAATSYMTGFGLTNATGYATSPQVTGKIYAADMAAPTPINLTTAVNNMLTAYTDAAGRPSPDFSELGTGNIGGKTLTPGLYKWSNTVTLPSNVTISGGANDVWIFQIAGNLSQSSAVNIILTGGAQAKNIFWQVAGQATMGTTSHFEGIILSQTGITFQTGASMNGRALAQTSVILDTNVITKP